MKRFIEVSNASYFWDKKSMFYSSPKTSEFVQSVIDQTRCFERVANLQSEFIDTINRLHNEDGNRKDDPYIMAETPNVIHVKCKLGRCPYLVWFKWEDRTIDPEK